MVAAFKVTAAVFKVPPGATVPVLTLRTPIVPPAPVMVPLVTPVVAVPAILPVTFKVPLITSMLPSKPLVLESPDKVRLPTPRRLSLSAAAAVTLLAMVLAALLEFKIN